MSERLTCIDSAGVISTAQYGSKRSERYGTQDCLEKLYRLENLEEQGRLIELPCKVGDIVYRIFAYCDSESGAVCSVHTCPCDYKNYEIFEKKFEVSDFDKIGKTIFLNKSEAEAKLKGMRGDQK